NGASFGWDNTSPFEFVFTVPNGKETLTFGAHAKSNRGGFTDAANVTVPVVADRLATLEGHVLDTDGRMAEGAEVYLMMSGLRAEFFDCKEPLTRLPDLPDRTPDRVSFVSAVNLRNPSEVFGNDPFGVGMSPDYGARLSGWIRIDQSGIYELFLGADEG